MSGLENLRRLCGEIGSQSRKTGHFPGAPHLFGERGRPGGNDPSRIAVGPDTKRIRAFDLEEVREVVEEPRDIAVLHWHVLSQFKSHACGAAASEFARVAHDFFLLSGFAVGLGAEHDPVFALGGALAEAVAPGGRTLGIRGAAVLAHASIGVM